MPTVSNVNLTLTTVDTDVTIRVTYDVEFNTFERKLTDLGLSYDTHVTIHDFDGGDTPGAQILDFYPGRYVLPVTSGNGSQVLARRRVPDGVAIVPAGGSGRQRRRAEGRRQGARQPVARHLHRGRGVR